MDELRRGKTWGDCLGEHCQILDECDQAPLIMGWQGEKKREKKARDPAVGKAKASILI